MTCSSSSIPRAAACSGGSRSSGGADGVAVGAGGVWVATGTAGQIVHIDPASGRIVGRIDIGPGLREIAVGPHDVWVTRDAI